VDCGQSVAEAEPIKRPTPTVCPLPPFATMDLPRSKHEMHNKFHDQATSSGWISSNHVKGTLLNES